MMMKRVLTVALLGVLLLAAAFAAGADTKGAGDFTLRILHVNDVNSNYSGVDSRGNPVYMSSQSVFGGAVRLARAVAAFRTPNTLLLNAGDEFQGTLYFRKFGAAPTVAVGNLLRYDVMTLGNHEFDGGIDMTRQLMSSLDFPIVSANVPNVKPWVTLERGGRTIGVFGLLTTELSSLSLINLKTEDTISAARRAVSELKARGVDIVIALTHIGFSEDKALAAAVDDIDVIVGGHSQSLLSNTHANAVAPYPTVVNSPSGAPVLIVQTDSFCYRLGRLDVTFDDAGRVASWDGDTIELDDATMAGLPQVADGTDKRIADAIDGFGAQIVSWQREKVGVISADVSGAHLEDARTRASRFGETRSGNIITDAILDAARRVDGEVSIALANGGGIRFPLPNGEVTVADVITTLGFGNMLRVIEVPGKVLKAALEHSVSRYEDGKGRFMQAAGLRCEYDVSKPVGSRLISVKIWDRKRDTTEPIYDESLYKVAMNNFIASGGDDFSMFNSYAPRDIVIDAVAVENYIRQNSPLMPKLEGRIIIRK